ncbi:MAG: serine/threonine protein kinase [Gammaproteobacteria bacterium]|nr:serine/threonine protein kinase [Gammaproteobacteria bacterium]MCP4090716.1 serine/threonine protein kinase [Gammaproteobacteria bacterium]MCP4277143.1 serine/threonine protein kinase [Gammaproteobacteria bacterium]MCP4832699.1 serine/threonine protein kinase [Gammaproteobacteria bacterium]MCP4928047.1 serine/threonine protein kinase [Gammaproteobacteria bacterium]
MSPSNLNTQQDAATLAYLQLHPDEIINAVESAGYHCDGRLLALNSYENRVYKVGLEFTDNIVVKFYRPGRWSDDAILEEHEFCAELAEHEVPVLAPLESEGETLHHRDEFRFAIFECKGGRAPELENMDLLLQLGRLVARIHQCGELYEFKHRPQLDIQSFGIASRDYLLEEGFIPADLNTAYESICSDVLTLSAECFNRAGNTHNLRLHGDFHPSNVLALGEQLHIVDLDDTRTGPAIQDLWMFLSGDRDEQTPQLHELLEGYTQFHHFDARELNLIEALRTLRVMHYAAWLARRWEDPAFKLAFPWFNSSRYWDEHVLTLREQAALMQEEPLAWAG